jgi:hypothetical protein
MRRPSPARLFPPRWRGRVRYAVQTDSAEPRRRFSANPAKLPAMAKRKASADHPQRRPRDEIDRNYFYGDVLIKTGVAVFVALGLIALFTPFTLMGAIEDGMYDYVAVMGIFGTLGLASFIGGRHLRRNATHWDFD